MTVKEEKVRLVIPCEGDIDELIQNMLDIAWVLRSIQGGSRGPIGSMRSWAYAGFEWTRYGKSGYANLVSDYDDDGRARLNQPVAAALRRDVDFSHIGSLWRFIDVLEDAKEEQGWQ